MVALTVAVPAAVVLKIAPEMVAPVVPAACTLHVMVLLVAWFGTTVPVRVSGVPAAVVAGTSEMSVTGTYAGAVVLNEAELLAGEAKWVAVSALRCVKV